MLGKTPCVGGWNENILPPCVKTRYDAARNVNCLLTSDVIDTAYTYKADNGTTGLAAGTTLVQVPINHASKMHIGIPVFPAHSSIMMTSSCSQTSILKDSSRLLPDSSMFEEIWFVRGIGSYEMRPLIMDSICHRMNSSTIRHRPIMSLLGMVQTTHCQVTAVVSSLVGAPVSQPSFVKPTLCLSVILQRRRFFQWIMAMLCASPPFKTRILNMLHLVLSA